MFGDIFMKYFGTAGYDNFSSDLQVDEDGELFDGKGYFVFAVEQAVLVEVICDVFHGLQVFHFG